MREISEQDMEKFRALCTRRINRIAKIEALLHPGNADELIRNLPAIEDEINLLKMDQNEADELLKRIQKQIE